ncbi:MAG: hypothetical protein WCF71_05090, partial [Verrucomicrobiia bacterium]
DCAPAANRPECGNPRRVDNAAAGGFDLILPPVVFGAPADAEVSSGRVRTVRLPGDEVIVRVNLR